MVLAAAVVFSHSFGIGAYGPDPLDRWSGGQLNFGGVAVMGFFAISGFLLTQSLGRQPFVLRYCVHRAARILPGYWVTLLISALVLAPLFLQFSGKGSYWDALQPGPNSALSYLARNWTLYAGQEVIDPLFAGNPGHNVVNGSLWTLYHEGMCYAGLLLVWFFRGLRPIVALLLFVSIYALHVMDFADHVSFVLMSPLMTMGAHFLSIEVYRSLYLGFAAGILIATLQLHEKWSPRWFWLAVGGLLLSIPSGFGTIAWPLTLPYILIAAAHSFRSRRAEDLGDWSYGVYLYAFPIQQCLAAGGLHQSGIGIFFLVSLALSLVAGALSWRFVEEPVLRWARRLSGKDAGSESLGTWSKPIPAAAI